jgi:protein involved in polysaccharide export with SLBB domain
MFMPTSLRAFLAGCLITATAIGAQNNAAPSGSGNSPSAPSRSDDFSKAQSPSSSVGGTATDPNYRLSAGDTLFISIGTQLETKATTSPTISKQGDVRLPWLNDEIVLQNKSVREAERFLEKLYRDRKMLVAPVVSVKIASYFVKEVLINGAVVRAGPMPFPADTVSMEIGELIFKAGGFAPGAMADKVRVYHRDAAGKETEKILDLESLNTGKNRPGKGPNDSSYLIYPGDRIDVKFSLF